MVTRSFRTPHDALTAVGHPRFVKLLVAVGFVLVLAPLARGDSILYATDRVPVPVQVLQVGIGGHGLKTIATAPVLDRGADGALLTADATGKTLLVDGRAVAQVDWAIDEAHFSPDGREIVFTSPSLAPSCEEYCQRWQLWLVGRGGSDLRKLSDDGRAPRFSPDGRSLAYLQGPRGESSGGYLTVIDLASGKGTRFGFADGAPPAWAPDSSAIAYSTYGTLSFGSVFVATLAPRRVVLFARHAWAPLFSPDGRSIAYVGRSGLTVQAVSGGRTVVVVPGAKLEYDFASEIPPSVAWSTSHWLVYQGVTRTVPSFSGQVFRVRSDGTHRAALTSFDPITFVPWIEARGTIITFQVVRGRGELATIDSIDLSSGKVTQLTHDSGDDQSPTLAPDGTLAYLKGDPKLGAWYCLAVTGRCLTKSRTGIAIREPPAWSPDGRELAVLDTTKGGIDLSVVDATTGVTRVVHDFRDFLVKSSANGNSFVVGGIYTNHVSSPSWSPDGRTIVVVSDQPGAQQNEPPHRSHLWLVDVATGRTTEIAPDVLALEPSWSPDGKTIAFTGYDPLGDTPGPIELYDVASGTTTPLVQFAPNTTGLDQAGNHARCRPAWSPDSSQLAYQAPDGSIHVIRRDGTDDRQVLPWALNGSAIVWQNEQATSVTTGP
jgi:Tol biopolymer transport system component